MDALGSLLSTQEARAALSYRLERLLKLVYTGPFYRATRAAMERRFYGDSKLRV